MQSFFKNHFQLIVFRKVLGWKLEESYAKKVYMSPRPPPKISLKHEWKRELGSEHAQRSEVGQLSRSFQLNQQILNPIRERTGRPVIRDDASTVQDERKTSRSQEIDVNSFHEELVSSERTERPVICKHYTSKYRKMATEFYMKTMATVYSYENKCATNYSIITKQQLERRVQQAAHQARHQ